MFRYANRRLCLILLCVLLISPFSFAALFLANPQIAYAASNSTINFQTKIVQKNTGLTPVTGSPSCIVGGADTCDIRISIYDSPSGGTLLWAETHSNVELGSTGGLINLSLNSVCNSWTSCGGGSGISWGTDDTLYVQIDFDTDGNGDFSSPETFARKLISSVPFAYYAERAGSINGFTENNLVQLMPGVTPQTVTNAANPLIYLNENDVSNSPNLIQMLVGGVDAFVVSNNGDGMFAGNLSAGTATSTAFLTVAAATSGQSSLRIMSSVGTNPSSPNSGDLWWNGTNLNFRTASTTVDLLASSLTSFVQGGNSFGAMAVLGTNDTNALAFETDGIERVRVSADGTIGIGTTSAVAQLQVNTGTSSGAITMSASNGSTTFTTSSSVTLNDGDYIVPAAPNVFQGREVTVGGTGTSFTVSPAFDATVTNRTFMIYRKNIMAQGARPVLSLNQIYSPFASQEWQLRVGGTSPGNSSFDIFNATNRTTAIRILDDGNVLIGSDTNYGGIGNASRLYVYGGTNGANIDVMGNGAVSDQATLELQSSDWETTGANVHLQYHGVNGIGTTLGYANEYLGVLSFSGATTEAVIMTVGNIPLRFGTDNLERVRIESNGDLTALNDLTINGGDITTNQTTFNLLNTTATTVNFAGAGSTINIGPASTTATTINFAGGSGDTGCTIDGTTGNLACSGTISGTFTVADDSLDFNKFEDTLDLDAALTINQTTNTWNQTFSGTTSTGLAYAADSLTSGTALGISSSATAFTGNLQSIALTGNNVANTGDLLEISITGTSTAARGLFIDNRGTGNSLEIHDVASDPTPFVVDASGNLSVGGNTASAGTLTTGGNIITTSTSIDVLNTTATTINFGGAGTTINMGISGASGTLNLMGGSGSTGCSVDGTTGNLTCSGVITGSSVTIANDSLDFDKFEDALDLDASTSIALGAFNLSTSGTGALNFASTGQVTLAGNVDATNGLDVTGANFTVGGSAIVGTTSGTLTTSGLITSGNGLTVSTGATSLGGSLAVVGNITTSSSSIDLLNTTATTINFGGAASTFNIGPGSTTATTINLAGGSGATGCTVDGATGNLTCSGTISGTLVADSLDFVDFQDTLDLDAALTLNQTTNTWSQTFTGTTTTGFGYAANSLTSGTALGISSSATAFTGNLQTISLTGNNAANTGDLLELSISGASSAARGLYINNLGTGDSFRIDDESSDATSLIVSADGSIGIGVSSTVSSEKFRLNSTSTNFTGQTAGMNIFSSHNATTNNTYNTFGLIVTNYVSMDLGITNSGQTYGGIISSVAAGDGVISNMYGLVVDTYQEDSGVSTNTTALSVSSNLSNGGTNNYGVYISTISGATNNYAIYSNSSANSYLGGDLLIAGGDLTTSQTTFNLINDTATTINFGGAASTLNIGPGSTTATSVNLAGGSDATGCTVDGATGNLTCSGNITGNTGLTTPGTLTIASTLATSATTVDLLNTTATTINFGGAASTFNIGPGSTTATSINFAGGSGATGCTIDGATGNLGCSGIITGNNGFTTGGTLTSSGVNTLGSTLVNYSPTTLNWGGNGSTLLLNASDYSVIGFHDLGSRVDFIRTGAGTITLGYDGGYGSAAISIPGTLTVTNALTSSGGAINLNASSNFAVNIATGTSTGAVSIGTGATAQTLAFGTGAGAKTVSIGSNTSGSTTTIFAGDASNTSFILTGVTNTNRNSYLCIGSGNGFVNYNASCTSSSIRFKENVINLGYGLDEIMALRPVFFNYKADQNLGLERKIGFVAEEVNEIIPEVTVFGNDGLVESLDYEKLVSLLTVGVQQLNTNLHNYQTDINGQLNDLRVTIDNLSAPDLTAITADLASQQLRINDLEARVQNLEAGVISQLTLPGTAEFAELVLTGKLNVKGQLILSNKNIGTATIGAGDLEKVVTFGQAFPNSPVVIAIPTKSAVDYSIQNTTNNSFKIVLDAAAAEDVQFNWFVSSVE